MQLSSYFPTKSQADEAAAALKSVGTEVVQVDKVSRYDAENDQNYNNPVYNNPSYNNPASNTDAFSSSNRQEDFDNRVQQQGAEPFSGDMNAGPAGNDSFKVTAVASEKNHDQAVNIIKQYGGTI
ncbi:MAG: hypothetical protein PHF87_09555 [Desulfotomaculaceae bacterium]|nr:hypothetical protein [Desulfotomaculaceae bacterium]